MKQEESPHDSLVIAIAGQTNTGKTTLARTLLRREVGLVHDRPNVTESAAFHADSEIGITIVDTPGFQQSGAYKSYLLALEHSKEGAEAIRAQSNFSYEENALGALRQSDIAIYVIALDSIPKAEHTTEVELIKGVVPVVAVFNKRVSMNRADGVPFVNERMRLWRTALKPLDVACVEYDAHVASPEALTNVLSLIKSTLPAEKSVSVERFIRKRDTRRRSQRSSIAGRLAEDLMKLRGEKVTVAIAKSAFIEARRKGRVESLASSALKEPVRECMNESLKEFLRHCSEEFKFQTLGKQEVGLEAKETGTSFSPGSGAAAAGYGFGGALVGMQVGATTGAIVAGVLGFLFGGPAGAAAAAGAVSLWGAGVGAVGGAAVGATVGLQGDSEAEVWFEFTHDALFTYASTAVSWAAAFAYHGFGKGAMVKEAEAKELGARVAAVLAKDCPRDLADASEETLARWCLLSLDALEV